MKRCALCLLFVALTWGGLGAEKVFYTRSSVPQGEFVMFIDRSRLEQLRVVDFSKEEAPVSIAEVCRTAEQFLRNKFPQYHAYKLYWVQLMNQSAGDVSVEHTAYAVSFYVWTSNDQIGNPNVVSATVLMDGKPVDFMKASAWDAQKN